MGKSHDLLGGSAFKMFRWFWKIKKLFKIKDFFLDFIVLNGGHIKEVFN